MRPLANFREFGVEGAPSVLEHVGRLENRRTIARYLDNGIVVFHVPEVVFDPVDPSRALGTGDIVTDGEWMWPAALATLVRRHAVELPPEFVERATAGRVAPFDVATATTAVTDALGLQPSVDVEDWWVIDGEEDRDA